MIWYPSRPITESKVTTMSPYFSCVRNVGSGQYCSHFVWQSKVFTWIQETWTKRVWTKSRWGSKKSGEGNGEVHFYIIIMQGCQKDILSNRLCYKVSAMLYLYVENWKAIITFFRVDSKIHQLPVYFDNLDNDLSWCHK